MRATSEREARFGAMADAAFGDADAERRRRSEERDTHPSGSPPERGLDALSHDDNVVRSQVALMLGDAVRDPSPLFDLGRSIEDAAWRAFAQGGEDGKTGASSPEYRACSRTLAANLRRNPDLRQRMLTGEWTPKQLVDLSATPDALATEQLRNLRREMDERATRKRTREMGLGDAIATDKYRCRDCLATGSTNANNCAYFNLQNHRDVRKNETWGSKDSQADDGRVLVRCLECKAEWNEATL